MSNLTASAICVFQIAIRNSTFTMEDLTTYLFPGMATNLKLLLECGICLNTYEDPRALPCLHSYCLNCLKSHASSTKDINGAFKCPQCRKGCILPAGGAKHFPKNFFLNTMESIISDSVLQETVIDLALWLFASLLLFWLFNSLGI